MQITVRSEEQSRQIDCRAQDTLLDVLRAHGYGIAADCNGRGTCGMCRVTVRGGRYGATGQTVLACQTRAFEGCEVVITERRGGGLIEGVTEEETCDGEDGYGLAVDIGTTTVAYALVRLSDGKILEKRAELNRQYPFGADVISRIQSACEGNAATLCRVVRAQIEETAQALVQKHALPGLKKAVVCGNPTMLHLFCDESVEGIGQYPFRPVFTQLRQTVGTAMGLCVDTVIVLPSVSAFVGADVVAGAVAAGADRTDALLVDIGTNGEMLLHAGDRLLCTSTAAGPCFEGATIECGMGGVTGAIDSFCRVRGQNVYTTIGRVPPCGLCGAGLIDTIAALLDEGMIDETGTFAQGDRFVLADGVWVSQKDVRAFQLAKSAIFSGLSLLCRRAGRSAEREKNIWIAGGLGYYLNGESARKTGLLPRANAAAQRAIGNAALSGTVLCLLRRRAVDRAVALAARTESIDLSTDPEFMDVYIQNMAFEI